MRKPETWKRTTTSKAYNSGRRRSQGGVVQPRSVKGEFNALLFFSCLILCLVVGAPVFNTTMLNFCCNGDVLGSFDAYTVMSILQGRAKMSASARQDAQNCSVLQISSSCSRGSGSDKRTWSGGTSLSTAMWMSGQSNAAEQDMTSAGLFTENTISLTQQTEERG